MKMNFEYFQIQIGMSQAVKEEKVEEKIGVTCLVSNFLLTSLGKLSLLKQFIYRHLKSLVMQFHKMVLFIMLWRTALKILGFGVEEFC